MSREQYALDTAILEARSRFRYIPEAPHVDEWDTPAEFEARGGGDCDGWTLWCLHRAAAEAPAEDVYWFVVGLVDGVGHAWAELRLPDGTRRWADPTYFLSCADPGWYSRRTPLRAYPLRPDGLLGLPTVYLGV
jgi:hypothetical protein